MAALNIRWALTADLPEIMDIERRCFKHAWTEKEFKAARTNANSVLTAVDKQGRIIGYMAYELYPHFILLKNFAVHPEEQRRGVGRAMVQKLFGKLSAERRNKITLSVSENNLNGHLFWKAMGFVATGVAYGRYYNTDEAAYLFEYELPQG